VNTDARDAAPGLLRLIQSFANTLTADDAADLLGTREEAAAWLRTAVLLPAEAGLSNSEHGALLRLRDSIRDILAAHAGAREDAEAAARLTKALADGRLVLIVEPASTVQLASAARASYAHVVASFAVAVAKSATAGTWLRLKTCSDTDCGQAFYDDSAAATADHCSRHAADGRPPASHCR
jgi:predicted RNA-binding Zn ribbon-like protein